MYSKVIQIYIYICIEFSRILFIIGYYKVLSIVPSAVQYILVGYLFSPNYSEAEMVGKASD